MSLPVLKVPGALNGQIGPYYKPQEDPQNLSQMSSRFSNPEVLKTYDQVRKILGESNSPNLLQVISVLEEASKLGVIDQTLTYTHSMSYYEFLDLVDGAISEYGNACVFGETERLFLAEKIYKILKDRIKEKGWPSKY